MESAVGVSNIVVEEFSPSFPSKFARTALRRPMEIWRAIASMIKSRGIKIRGDDSAI